MRKSLKRFMRRGQIGQSIVILALGFIGLVAVVGITTDVSILFARYAQLRRAVDSASIAAAGQMRQDRNIAEVGLAARQFIEFHGLNPRNVWVETCANAPIEDTDPGTVGIQPPSGTLADNDPQICSADQRKLVRVTAQIVSPTVFLRLMGWGDIILEASAISETAVLDVVIILNVSESMLNETRYADWADVGMGIGYVPPRIDHGTPWWYRDTPPDMVLTRMADPTIRANLGITGFEMPSIDTGGTPPRRYIDFTQNNNPQAPFIPTAALSDYDGDGLIPQAWWADWFWQEYHLGVSQKEVNDRLHFTNPDGSPADGVPPSNSPFDANNVYYQVRSFIPNDVAARGGNIANQRHPRPECRVRFYPYSRTLDLNVYMRNTYTSSGINWGNNIPPEGSPGKWGGFVPTYNFYGCCNDPGTQATAAGEGIDVDGNILPVQSGLPDGDFSDLVCQPFKQARDATRQFLERIDFLRGDRVAFVTFDRSAHIVDPDGEFGGPDRNLSHMIEDLDTARRTLNQHIGVRAEPNFYVWNENGGGWTDAAGITQFAAGIDLATGDSIPIDYNDPNLKFPDTKSNNYPATANCEVQNAVLSYPFSRYATRNVDGLEQQPALRNIMTPYVFGGVQFGIDWDFYRRNPGATDLNTSVHTNADLAAGGWGVNNAYELWAACRGTNVGAALRQGSSALTIDPTVTRTEGTVWVMILLGDGAAGASDPARIRGVSADQPTHYLNTNANPTAPRYDWTTNPALNPAATGPFLSYTSNPRGNYNLYGQDRNTTILNTYGFYGVCPPGGRFTDPVSGGQGEIRLGELMRTGTPSDEPIFPYCSDEDPATRHFCLPSIQARLDGTPSSVGIPNFDAGFGPSAQAADYDFTATLSENVRLGRVYDLDIGTYGQEPSCDMLYDVDDYARDWADFIAGIPPVGSRDFDVDQTLTLPIIFTIGFGLNFDRGDGSCEQNIPDCLGEELLRYIADVGDNFRVDTDYQQDWRFDGQLGTPHRRDDPAGIDYGPPDPCQPDPEVWTYDPSNPGNIQFRTPGESCGNYYNAPGQAELEQVFDDIASRMFTRLTG